MQWWIIIKMIAGIIANLPFNADEPQVRAAVAKEVEKAQDQVSAQSVGIPQGEWEELAAIITSLFLWVVKRFSAGS